MTQKSQKKNLRGEKIYPIGLNQLFSNTSYKLKLQDGSRIRRLGQNSWLKMDSGKEWDPGPFKSLRNNEIWSLLYLQVHGTASCGIPFNAKLIPRDIQMDNRD